MLTRILNRFRPVSEKKEPVMISEEYIEWLSFANAGMLQRGNIYCIDLALSQLPSSAPVLEIGSFCGLSTNIIAHYLKKHKRTNPIFTCDKWEFEGSENTGTIGDSDITHAEYRSFCKESFMRNVSLFSSFNKPHTIEVFSDDFFSMWNAALKTQDIFGNEIQLGGPVSFAFIDGNHSYSFTQNDFNNTDAFLEVGGFILFDDSGKDSPFECKNLMPEISATGRYKLIAENPNFLFKKLKHK